MRKPYFANIANSTFEIISLLGVGKKVEGK